MYRIKESRWHGRFISVDNRMPCISYDQLVKVQPWNSVRLRSTREVLRVT